jgi:cytochrome c-type biogenesis protein CcmH/NrfG
MTTLSIIVFVVLGLALTVYALRPGLRRGQTQSPSEVARLELEEERDTIYKHIRDLEMEHEQGLVDATDYQRLRLRDETRAALILEKIADLPPAPPPRDAQSVSRPVWPFALGVLVLAGVGALAANAFAVPPLQMLALRPGEVETYRLGRELNVLEAKLTAEAHTNPDGPTTETLLEYGEAAWKLQDYARAATAYGAILRRDPRNAMAVRRYGIILFFSGQNNAQALELLRASIRLEPSAEAYMTIGNLLFSQQDAKGAIDAWEKYLEIAPPAEAGRVPELIAAARKQLGTSDPGERLFAQNCASCHGANAQGLVGPNLKTSANAKDRAFVTNQIMKGSKNAKMPAFTKFNQSELQDLVSYINRLK